MRKHTLTAYRKLIRLFGLFGLLSVFLFPSCEDLQADESEEKSLSSSKTYTVSFKVADAAEDSSSELQRNIYPSKIIVGGLSFLLQGEPIMPPEGYELPAADSETPVDWTGWTKDESRTMDGDTKLLNGIQYPTKDELDKASFNLDSGAWKFLLKAYSNDAYRATENGAYTYEGEYSDGDLRLTAVSYVREITAGNNVITFNMKLADDIPAAYKYGSIKLVLNCYLGENTCSVVGNENASENASDKGITVSLTKYKDKNSETIDDTFDYASIVKTITVGATTNDALGKAYTPVTYETENTIPKGEYSIFVKIPLVYGKDSGGNPKQTFATFKDTEVVVETGSQSYLNKNLTDLRQRYTIEYKSVEVTHTETEDEYEVVDFNYFNNEVDVFEYNPSSKTKVVLPEIVSMTRTNKVFLGWYDSYDETTHKFGKEAEEYASKTSFSPTGLTGKITFWAQWGDLDIYVSENGNDKTGNGSLTSPYKTLTKAIERIHDYPNTNLEWTIYIIGSVTAGTEIKSSGDETIAISAHKITITGYNKKGKSDNWVGADGLVTSTDDKAVVNVNTNFPVELSYLTIKHNSNTETGELATGSGLKFGADTVSDTKITFNHVKVFNNEVTNSEGAGISNYMDMTLINCEISNNKAKLVGLTTGSAGGGIYNRNVLSLTDCVISNNYSGEKGGGIYNSGSLSLTGCTISSNSSVMGGGIQNENEMTISSSTFDSNTATTNGGGIYSTTSGNKGISDCTVDIDNTTFIKNTAPSGYGGAIAMICSSDKPASITLMNNVTIGGEDGNGNTALYGGGICISRPVTNNTPPDCNIIGENVDISWNKAVHGAGIYLEYANLDMESGSIRKNTAKNEAKTSGEGGGICAYYATATIKGSISENAALNGAGLYSEGSSITLTGSIIDNIAENDGGGIYFVRSSLPLTGTLSITMSEGAFVKDNRAENGGGLYCESKNGTPSVFAMEGGTISGNKASENGGGVYIVGSADTAKFTFNMAAGKISGNTESTNGGGVYIGQYGEMFMYGSAVVGDAEATTTSNSATIGGGIYNAGNLYLGYSAADTPVNLNGGLYFNSANNGGGLYNAATGTCYFASGVIASNIAEVKEGVEYTGFGGGVYNLGEVYMHSSAIIGNASAGTCATSEKYSNTADHGGGVYNENKFYLGYSSDSDTEGTTLNGGIYYNMATTSGGGIYNNNVNSEFVMLSGYIKDNYASGEVWSMAGGGGAYNKMGTFTMKGGHITCNAANGYGGGVSNLASMFMTGNAVIGFDEDVESVSNYSNLATYGGGVYNNGVLKLGYASTTDTTGTALNGGIFYNASTGGPGGGVFTALTFYMKSGKILNNKASSGKNGLFKSSGNAYIEGGTVQDD